MEQLKLTCPFTGLEFTACLNGDELLCSHPIKNEQMGFKIDMLENAITIPLEYFAHIELMAPIEAAEKLDITRQRMSQLMANDTIPAYYIGQQAFVKSDDVMAYRDNRSIGRPRKEEG